MSAKRLFMFIFCMLAVSALGTQGARAELALVSPGIDADGEPGDVTLFPEGEPGANFPQWYEDTRGLRLTLCLDGEEEEPPCAWEDAPVFTDDQCQIPFYEYEDVVGFGDEAFYFKAQSYPFDVPLYFGPEQTEPRGSAQLQLLLETTFGEDERFEDGELQDLWLEEEDGTCRPAVVGEDDLHRIESGYELLFARVRLRVLPDSPIDGGDEAPEGWYRMTHPYGVKSVYHPTNRDDGDHRLDSRTEVRQVIGDLVVPEDGWDWNDEFGGDLPDYTISLNDVDTLIERFGEETALENYIGLRLTGFTNDDGLRIGRKSVGPFLYYFNPETKADFRTEILYPEPEFEGNLYIGRAPFEDDPEASPGHQVLGSPVVDRKHWSCFQNYFRIEYQEGDRETPPDDQLWVQVGYTEEFNVVGKVALGMDGYTEEMIPGHLICPVLSPGIHFILLDEEE